MNGDDNLLYAAIKRELDLFRADVKEDVAQVHKEVEAVSTAVTFMGNQIQDIQAHDRDAEVASRTRRAIRSSLVKIVLGSTAAASAVATVAALFVHAAG